MGLIEFLLIAVGIIAAAFLLVTIVRRISAYYRQRYNMSVWAGTFILVIATVIIAYSLYHYNSITLLCGGATAVLLIITSFLDIRHAGAGMGVLALLFQIVLAIAFIAVVLVAVLYFIIRALRRGDDLVLDAITGTTSGFRNGVQLFFRFFIP